MKLWRWWDSFRGKLDTPAATVFVLAAMAGVGLAAAISSMLDREPPTVFEIATALTPEVPQGGVLDVQYTVRQNRVCTATVERYITDVNGNIHVPSTYTVGKQASIEGYPPEGRETYHRSVTVPLAASVGPARYDARFTYTCGMLQKLAYPIVVDAPPIRFMITPAPASVAPLTPDP
ncbi:MULTISPECIES: hypothetical protein [unclassified Mesorhizobium]|uniref:hypothetical protein n=1 Tax=unclassified Mesorhizobium TaxID=325217 RepID=UPI000FDC29EB|nr:MULTISPECIES: hypothetical protein [unclassified Mesorhizobium]TGT76697.1 hypothetical protein EN809_003575 [Mesorhizobium sp. M2E.F.Ca.ET.166.01.1.1]TGW02809.1 hypothetical protein EN797_003575 [Mesorhizobium sp. M2E.F.Ca.ET.154.01.1.1]